MLAAGDGDRECPRDWWRAAAVGAGAAGAGAFIVVLVAALSCFIDRTVIGVSAVAVGAGDTLLLLLKCRWLHICTVCTELRKRFVVFTGIAAVLEESQLHGRAVIHSREHGLVSQRCERRLAVQAKLEQERDNLPDAADCCRGPRCAVDLVFTRQLRNESTERRGHKVGAQVAGKPARAEGQHDCNGPGLLS